MNARQYNNPTKHSHWFGRRNPSKSATVSRKNGWWKKAVLQSKEEDGRNPTWHMRRMGSLKTRW